MFGLKKIISTFFIVSSVLFLIRVNGSIVIDIENDDVQRIGEILIQHYLEQQLTSTLSRTTRTTTYSMIVSTVQTLSLSIVKMIAVMLTLVGANLITSKLDSPSSQPIDYITNENSTINFCSNFEYGCKQNVCWRKCDKEVESNGISEKNDTLAINTTFSSWCFTTANPDERDFQQCDYSYDCSPCWPCLSPCHSPPK